MQSASISIHAPREGCDPGAGGPYWRACDFNPRTPRGVRRHGGVQAQELKAISIHAPREGCDIGPYPAFPGHQISIHAPREGCDVKVNKVWGMEGYISIHAPREGCDRAESAKDKAEKEFQSTHPARGATANFTKEQRVCLAQFAYLHKGKKAEHTKTNAPMLHEAFLYAFWVRTGRRRRVILDFARYKIKGSSGR